ncbi:WD40-repeat-containing domain protein [Powellomyces hirtus]|nr:WD40-repeat-containing domain protein [Powellomyces hirtus]
MNLELLDPFGQHCPELVDGTLSNGDITLCCRFNYRGNLLATGTLDGACVVWDMDTKSIARSMTGHVQPVNSVSWSKSGRYLLTASTDWNCILWDLKDGSRARTIRFGCPIESAQMHSTKNNIFIVVLQSGGAVLIKLAESFGGPVQRSNFAGYYEGDRSGMTQIREERCRSACFDPTGEQVLIGTQKGQVVILDTETFSVGSTFNQLVFAAS